jgi:hypothetical protein
MSWINLWSVLTAIYIRELFESLETGFVKYMALFMDCACKKNHHGNLVHIVYLSVFQSVFQ